MQCVGRILSMVNNANLPTNILAKWTIKIICNRNYENIHKFVKLYTELGMLTGLDFPGSRKNFPFPGKKFPDREDFGEIAIM